jgi:uncharacterized protein (DUF983 family)
MTLGRALRLRCPRCGGRGLFESWLRPRPSCPTCGQPIERPEEGYWLGALLVNLVVAELLPLGVVVAVLLATWPHPPWDLLLYGGAALAVCLAVRVLSILEARLARRGPVHPAHDRPEINPPQARVM